MPSPVDSKSKPIKNDTTRKGSGKHLNGTLGVPRERYRHGKHNYAKPKQSATMETWLKEPSPFGVSVAKEIHDATTVSDLEKEMEATLGAPPPRYEGDRSGIQKHSRFVRRLYRFHRTYI